MFKLDKNNRVTPLDQGFGIIVAITLACVVVGVLAFSLGREGERDSKRASEYEKYADRRKGAYCVDLAGVSHAKCEIEQEEAAREAYNAERDLNAQRDMATWALAVFIISSITAGLTLWALWYVRRTLVATVAAVEETSRATWAMEQQNKIAEAGQRPWMAVDIKIENPRRTPEGFNFVLSVIFKNIGKTSAKNYKSSHDIIIINNNNLIEVKKFFLEMRSSHNFDGIDTIMPGEIRGTHTSIHFNKNNIPWKIENGQKVIRIAIVCAAYYASESSSSKFTTQRCFLIGTIEANNPGKHLYITEGDFDDIENKKLVTPLHGWVHTT